MNAGFDFSRVQHEACPVCVHDTSTVPGSDLAPALSEAARRWRDFIAAVLDYPGGIDDLCVRPRPEQWSAVEYACHTRDVLSLCGRRLELTLLSTNPELAPWDQESAASIDHYLAQDPQAVADDIVMAAAALARLVQPLTASQWSREATQQAVSFTAEGLVRIALHEALHHLDDARAVVPAPTI